VRRGLVYRLLSSHVAAFALCRYACYYLTRNSLTYTAPVMTADPALKMDITQVGTMTSIFPIAYGFSKFLSGVLGARTSPRVMLAGGLMATAIVNILFGFGHSMVWFCSFWALNGVLQVMSSIANTADPWQHWFGRHAQGKLTHLRYAGLWWSMLCTHPDLLVCNQGERHLLGHVEHCSQPGRFWCAYLGRKCCSIFRLEMG